MTQTHPLSLDNVCCYTCSALVMKLKIKGSNKPQAQLKAGHVISPLEYYVDLQFPHKATTLNGLTQNPSTL